MTDRLPGATSTSVEYRAASLDDVDPLARLRAREWGSVPYWRARIQGYMTGELGPREALPERTVVVAARAGAIVGFAAAHRTTRLGCSGELEWLNVEPRCRRQGIATRLLVEVAEWFVRHRSTRVCVDPDDAARAFYLRHGAEALDEHWLVWPDIGAVADAAARQGQRTKA
jgi:GNAT superfamily N-acetyltransferase